jgi:hypothetical protein
MSEEENEVVQQATIEPSESVESNERQEETQKSRSRDQEYNWGEARRKMQDLERKAQEQDELIRRLQGVKQGQEDEDMKNLTDDDIVTVSQAKKLASKMAREVAENVMKQNNLSTLEERINNKYPDFQKIVSREAVEQLKSDEPELAASLSSMQDPYQQAIAAYKLIKKMGGKDELTLEQRKAIENRSKPQSVQTVTKNSAIGNAHMFENGLTKELKAKLYKEMCDAAKAG